ncbi:MAG: prolyl oligopeptidase family serine peptidase [Thermoplasmata archaeon]
MVKVHNHSIDDFLNSKNASDVDFSIDGSKVVFTIYGRFKNLKEEPLSEVAVLSTKDGRLRSFSQQGWANFCPKISPSGTRLAYLSKKGEDYRLMLYDLGNESGQEIVVDGAVDGLRWEEEGSLIFLKKDKDTKAVEKEKGDDGYFFEEEPRFDSLWRFDLISGLKRITKGFQVWEYDVNGGTIAAITSPLPYEWSWYEAEVSLIGPKDGKVKRIYSKKDRQLAKPRLSPDNKKLVLLESLWSDRGVNSGDIISIDLKSLRSENMTEGDEESYTEVKWKSEREFYALSNKDGTFYLYLFSGNNKKELWSKFGSVQRAWSPSFSVSKDKSVISFESSKQPNEVFMIDLKNGKEKKTTNINKQLDGCKSYDTELVSWKSRDGLKITGLFRSAGKNAPLMVIVHGGPTGSSTDSFISDATMYLSHGYSVFLPNYRGSVGRGRKYAELNLGDMGGMDLQDIISGVEYMVKERGLNKNRIFITGGSYGGFMSAWAITQTDIFRGAVSLFGISDWISFHGVSNLPTWDRIHYNEDPYKFNKFLKFSPIWFADRVKTPVLLAHGIEDPYVPVGQYYQFYRALKDMGKDVRLLLFPREGHGFRERKHVEKFYREVFDWLKEKS